jgi:hypothetical protein
MNEFADEVLTEARFWVQVTTDSERTIICSPENESRIKSWIDARGLGHILKVMVETYVPDDQMFVIDHNAIEASQRQWIWKPGTI